ncbi:MAG TPA: hypothetical protein VK625_06660 [Flavitalea sp.]|nr:hypothetical protein [Flavitalea sp.]
MIFFTRAILFFCASLLYFNDISAQELFVFSEPASNMPAKSVSAKYTAKFVEVKTHETKLEQRHSPEIMLGINKNWMVHGAVSFSDMYSNQVRWESARVYAKYRFLSNDEVHRHFRMAAFGEVSQSRNKLTYEEISFEGDQSGIQAGIIATQLWKKFALSSTVSALQVTTARPKVNADHYTYQAFNYSVSAGLLVLPFEYTSYNQTNLNIYAELLGQQSLDKSLYYVDLAPALQLIFRSAYKLNMGYRFQLNSNMHRMAKNSFQIGLEVVFLNALKKKDKI